MNFYKNSTKTVNSVDVSKFVLDFVTSIQIKPLKEFKKTVGKQVFLCFLIVKIEKNTKVEIKNFEEKTINSVLAKIKESLGRFDFHFR